MSYTVRVLCADKWRTVKFKSSRTGLKLGLDAQIAAAREFGRRPMTIDLTTVRAAA